jgi:hypothetical protein
MQSRLKRSSVNDSVRPGEDTSLVLLDAIERFGGVEQFLVLAETSPVEIQTGWVRQDRSFDTWSDAGDAGFIFDSA